MPLSEELHEDATPDGGRNWGRHWGRLEARVMISVGRVFTDASSTSTGYGGRELKYANESNLETGAMNWELHGRSDIW